MKQIEVNIPRNSYNIYIEKGLLEKLDELIKTVYEGRKVFLITDSNVDKIYGEKAVRVLAKGFDVRKIVIAPRREQ